LISEKLLKFQSPGFPPFINFIRRQRVYLTNNDPRPAANSTPQQIPVSMKPPAIPVENEQVSAKAFHVTIWHVHGFAAEI
jgi:hypothetical protein